MWKKKLSVPLIMFAFAVTGCESLGELTETSANQPQAIASNVNGSGTIASVQIVPRSQGLGLGTLAGAAVGGVLGSQVGGGSGKTAATVAGVAGGAYMGHQIEKQRRSDNKIYKVTIRMDDGSTQSFAQEAEPSIKTGDRVTITNGVLSRL
jgi:outer membrane lipoprotein SlyB